MKIFMEQHYAKKSENNHDPHLDSMKILNSQWESSDFIAKQSNHFELDKSIANYMNSQDVLQSNKTTNKEFNKWFQDLNKDKEEDK